MKMFILLLSVSFVSLGFISCGDKSTSSTKATDSTSVNHQVNENAITKLAFYSDTNPGGTIIPKDSADTLISRYRRDYANGNLSMNTPDGLLKGFYISKDAFTALSKDQNMTGVMAYFGEVKGERGSSLTLVFVPTKMDAKARKGEDHPDVVAWEEIDPCPKMCGGTGDDFGNH